MRWPPLLDWCTDPSCPKLGRENHAFLLKMEIFLPWRLFPKRNRNLEHIASTGSDSTECWSKQDWHDMTAGNGFGWLQSSGLLWLALVQSAAPPAPLVVAAKNEIETQTNLSWHYNIQRVLLRLVHSAELSDQVRGIPAFQKNVHFLTNIGQNKCGNVLHDPLFIHFLWRSRSGRPNLIFWESKRALALPIILFFQASVFYTQAIYSLRYFLEAGTRLCAQGSSNQGN